MNRATCVFMLFAVGLFLMPCNNNAMAEEMSGQLVISGSDALEPLTVELAKRFMKIHKKVKIVVKGGESGAGIDDTRGGRAAIGMISKPLNSQDAVDLKSFVVAYEGICFITSSKNTIHDLSLQQLKGIFLGKIINWQSVGGDNLLINSLIPYRHSSSNRIVADFLGVQVSELKGKEISDLEDGLRAVTLDPKAIFYISTGKAFHEKLAGRSFNILSVSGKKANMVAIAKNRYPLTRTLSYITKGEPSPLAKAFIAYSQSPAATHAIRSLYLIKPE